MSVQPAKQSRREERRTQTSQEITTLAMEQVAAGGPDSVSLNAIARAMRMSPAALYRYFDSRDALLADLVGDHRKSRSAIIESRDRGSARVAVGGVVLLRG